MAGTLKRDFEADMRAALVADMTEWGHAVSGELPFGELVSAYANLRRRRIEPRPRKVHLAKMLVVPPECQAGYALICDKATSGGDLNPHLSKSVHKDAGYDDMMLNDWVMHHLHLGTDPHPRTPAIVNRTGELLFAMVQRDDFYVVAIGEHGDWADQRLFETARENWPELFHELRGLTIKPVSQADTEKLRAAGVSVVQAGPGGVPIFPKGGGYATSGRSIEVTRNADRLMSRIREAEAAFAAHETQIIAMAKAKGIDPDEVEFHLRQGPDAKFFAADEKHNLKVILE